MEGGHTEATKWCKMGDLNEGAKKDARRMLSKWRQRHDKTLAGPEQRRRKTPRLAGEQPVPGL